MPGLRSLAKVHHSGLPIAWKQWSLPQISVRTRAMNIGAVTDIHVAGLQWTSDPTQEAAQSNFHDGGNLGLPTLSSSQGMNN